MTAGLNFKPIEIKNLYQDLNFPKNEACSMNCMRMPSRSSENTNSVPPIKELKIK
jgi:hypothetical protein